MDGNYSGNINLAAFNAFLVNTVGFLLGSDLLTTVAIVYNGAGAGRYNIKVGWNFGSTIQQSNPGEVVLGGLTLVNTYFAQNLSSLDFCNLTYPSPNSTVANTKVDFRFQDRAGLNVQIIAK